MRWTGESFEDWAIVRNIPRPVPRRSIRMCALHAQPDGLATWAGWWVMTHFVSSLDFRAWYTLRMLYSIGHALPIFLIVLGLIAFRLIWPNPLADKVTIRYLPKSWQRWLLDKPRSSLKRAIELSSLSLFGLKIEVTTCW